MHKKIFKALMLCVCLLYSFLIATSDALVRSSWSSPRLNWLGEEAALLGSPGSLNAGQIRGGVSSEPRSSDPGSGLLQYTAGEQVLGFRKGEMFMASGDHALRVEFIKANPVNPIEERRSPDSKKDKQAAQPLGKVTYRDLWDGLTLAYERNASGGVRSTYRIERKGRANPVNEIRLRYNVPVKVDGQGNLIMSFPTGQMRESRPEAWQEIEGKRMPVEAAYQIKNEREVGFRSGTYDPEFPLWIAPVLSWNTFLGSYDYDRGFAIATDTSGNVYVTGYSWATWGSPVRPFIQCDAFVAKLNGSGILQWNTFLGGSGLDDYGYAIAVDSSGSVYVAGASDWSWGSPVMTFNGGAFVAKLDNSGVLQWNGFLGGNAAFAIALDTSGSIYIAGSSVKTWGSPVRPWTGGYDAFAAKLDGNGALQWNTFLGSAYYDCGYAIAVDTSGIVFVGGTSYSTWGSPIRPYAGGNSDAFAAKLDGNGALQWNTFMGGTGTDHGRGIAADTSGSIYIAGSSDAAWGSPVNPCAGAFDAFAAKLDGNGALQWNTFMGGPKGDDGNSIAVNTGGSIYIAGTSSAGWGSPVRPFTGQWDDAFVAKISDRIIKDDFVGAWPGQGVYYRNSDTERWVLLETSTSSQIAVGDLDGDGIDDFIGIFPNDPGVWTKRSSTNTWLRLDGMTPYWIAVGDMNGDGRVDFVGAWNNGVYYRNSITGSWALLETSLASQIAIGDLDGDGKGDLIGVFPNDPGVWTKRSSTQTWLRLDSVSPSWIAVGDLSGDGKPDLLGTWPGSGVYYKDSATGRWVLLETSVASQVVAGDLDGDGKKDLIGVFPNDPGVWTKRSSTLTWLRLDSSTPTWIAAGRMRAAGATAGAEMSFRMPSSASGLRLGGNSEDLSAYGPHGKNFTYTIEKNARYGIKLDESAQRSINSGPGEFGFKPIKDESASTKKK